MIRKNNYKKIIEELSSNDMGIYLRELIVSGVKLYILYIPQIVDKESISTSIIKPILLYEKKNPIDIDIIYTSIIYSEQASIDHEEKRIVDYILQGNTIIIIPNEQEYIVINTFQTAKRDVSFPQLQTGLKSPLDSFTEDFDTNLSLIRYRIKDSALRIDNLKLGRRTKTKVAVIYINDIANTQFIKQIKDKLEKINVDGILETGYIQKFLQSSPFSIFPESGIAERSDKACASILNGKICIIVEGSNLALTLPETFNDFLDSGEEHYDNMYSSMLTKVLRLISFITTLTLSSLYVVTVSFLPEILPPNYILALANSRVTVPVNSFVEAFIMETVAEILREASVRLPKQIGPAIGIVGTIVIGQAAVSAGVVSPLMVIIVSLTTLTSFAFPEHIIINPIRVFKFMMLVLTGIFGIFGFTMGLTLVIISMVSTQSIGVPLTAAFLPYNTRDFFNFFVTNIKLRKKRPKFSRTQDETRQ